MVRLPLAVLCFAACAGARRPVVMIGGGSTDPNLDALVRQLQARGNADVLTVFMGPNSVYPDLAWNMDTDVLTLRSTPIAPDAAFLRYDVFSWIDEKDPTKRAFNSQRAGNLHTMLEGWLQAHHSSCRYLNPDYTLKSTNKLEVIALARRIGFDVPSTLITHNMDAAGKFGNGADKITKPVGGGGYAELLSSWQRKYAADERAAPGANPRQTRAEGAVIVQETLVQPEMRIFGIAGTFLAFRLTSPSRTNKDIVDYRVNQDAKLEQLDFLEGDGAPPAAASAAALLRGLAHKQAGLMREMGLEFGAADFKRRGSASGPDVFLEINSGPMFAAFDWASHSMLVDVFAAFLEGVPYRCAGRASCYQPDLAAAGGLKPFPEGGAAHSAWIRKASQADGGGGGVPISAAGGGTPGIDPSAGGGAAGGGGGGGGGGGAGGGLTRADLDSAIKGLRASLSGDLVKMLGKNRIRAQTSMTKSMGQALESGLSQLGNSELQQSDKLERELLSHLTAVELEQKRLGAGTPTQYGLVLAVLVGGIAVSAINQLFCRRYSRASGPRL